MVAKTVPIDGELVDIKTASALVLGTISSKRLALLMILLDTSSNYLPMVKQTRERKDTSLLSTRTNQH